jgi:hypothetical protein
MFQLNKFSDSFLVEYQEKIWKEFEKQLNTSDIKDQFLNTIDENNIKKIFIQSPEDLQISHNLIMPTLGSWKTITEYDNYFVLRKKKKKNQTEKETIEKYKQEIKQIERLFNYKEIISKKKPFSYWLAEELKCNTCTYCNRNYTFTISKDKSTGRTNNDTRITRPQFDHWFSKSKHPILALSIYNLIPSCSICNSGIKGSKEFSLKDHFHPYIPNNDTFNFSYDLNSTNQPTVKIRTDSKILKDTFTLMKLEELYKAHDDFELKDLFDLARKYGKNYTKTLFGQTFKDLNLDEKEIYRLVFGADLDNHQKRLMSKFKHDIIEELRRKF